MEAVQAVGTHIPARRLVIYHVGNKLSGNGPKAESQHVVPSRDKDIVEIGRSVDDGKAVRGHGTPPPPLLLGRSQDLRSEVVSIPTK